MEKGLIKAIGTYFAALLGYIAGVVILAIAGLHVLKFIDYLVISFLFN